MVGTGIGFALAMLLGVSFGLAQGGEIRALNEKVARYETDAKQQKSQVNACKKERKALLDLVLSNGQD